MRVPVSWLKEYVDFGVDSQTLADKLTDVGVAVERVEITGGRFQGVYAAKIEDVIPVAGSDHLKAVTVDCGQMGRFTVVSGAPNLEAGDVVPLALPGAVLPDGRTIDRAEFKGVGSEGMLCSAAELGLGDAPEDAAGIMVLSPDTVPGTDLSGLGRQEEVLELDLTPNYAVFCQSMIGVAREVAAVFNVKARKPRIAVSERGTDARELIAVEIEDSRLCRRYSARIVEEVSIGPSPNWMQQRLRAAGIRPINNIVDVTNYVMLEYGQPLHAFDADLVRGGRIIVRRAAEGEVLRTLDGTDRTLTERDLVIADPERAIALAGVMGGENTEITGATRRVLIESAVFDPVSVRRTSFRLGLRSEASMRFEKGIDPETTVEAATRAAALMAELGGGTVLPGVVDNCPVPVEKKKILLRPGRANQILGTGLSAKEMAALLRRLEFEVSDVPGGMEILVPTWRGDVSEEIDLIEEIARLYGYNNIETTFLRGEMTPGGRSASERLLDVAVGVLLGAGFSEAYVYSFHNRALHDRLLLPGGHPDREAVALANPMSEEQAVLRTGLLPGLLTAAGRNHSRHQEDVALFEVGTVFKQGDAHEERRHLGMVVSGLRWPKSPGAEARNWDFLGLKGVLEAVSGSLGVSLRFVTGTYPAYHPGRVADILLEGRVIGHMGEVHPEVAESFGLRGRAVAAELDLDALLPAATFDRHLEPLPRYPAVERDLAVVVDRTVSSESLLSAIVGAGGELLEEARLFDRYEGKNIGEGKVSLAYSLVFRAKDRTLTESEVEEAHRRIVEALEKDFGARLRS